MMSARFVNNMITVRRLLGMSETELAVAAGMTRNQIANLAHGRREPRLGDVIAISAALGVPPTALEPALGGE